MAMLFVLILLLIVFAVIIFLTAHLVGLILHLFMAAVIGALADAVVPGRLPYGFLGAMVAGLIGSWIGTALLHQVVGPLGPLGLSVFGVPLIPAFLGAVLVAFVARALAPRAVR
ncbi:MAG: GlsB/YeaQ/YmgE family stress response membrane protein [Chloroflexi bacterium]|nr:GlsB/YeaQ/YmgE family stress response membrane protein [Chloroflexota bacterium]